MDEIYCNYDPVAKEEEDNGSCDAMDFSCYGLFLCFPITPLASNRPPMNRTNSIAARIEITRTGWAWGLRACIFIFSYFCYTCVFQVAWIRMRATTIGKQRMTTTPEIMRAAATIFVRAAATIAPHVFEVARTRGRRTLMGMQRGTTDAAYFNL